MRAGFALDAGAGATIYAFRCGKSVPGAGPKHFKAHNANKGCQNKKEPAKQMA